MESLWKSSAFKASDLDYFKTVEDNVTGQRKSKGIYTTSTLLVSLPTDKGSWRLRIIRWWLMVLKKDTSWLKEQDNRTLDQWKKWLDLVWLRGFSLQMSGDTEFILQASPASIPITTTTAITTTTTTTTNDRLALVYVYLFLSWYCSGPTLRKTKLSLNSVAYFHVDKLPQVKPFSTIPQSWNIYRYQNLPWKRSPRDWVYIDP